MGDDPRRIKSGVAHRNEHDEGEQIYQEDQASLNDDEKIHEEKRNENQNVHIADESDIRFFSVDEVGDLLKSRKNLIYMFRLSNYLTRLLFATRQNVHSYIPERCAC